MTITQLIPVSAARPSIRACSVMGIHKSAPSSNDVP
jgi:hypothetical protein